MTGLFVIQDETLRQMAHNAKITAEFPFLKGLTQLRGASRGCGGCGGARLTDHSAVYHAARTQIAALSGTQKQRLKTLLNAGKVRIMYKQAGTGATVQLTF